MTAKVIKFKKPRRETIRGVARRQLTDAMRSVANPVGVVIIALGRDGSFARRSCNHESMADIDLYSRSGGIIDKARLDLLVMSEK